MAVSDVETSYYCMTMTTQGCPLHETMVQDVKRYAKKVPGVANVNVDVVWDPPWTMDKLSDDAKETLKKMGTGVGLSTPAPVNYETALPQGTGNLVKQEDGSMVLANEHEQGFMVNDAIVEFWKMCNGWQKLRPILNDTSHFYSFYPSSMIWQTLLQMR